MKQFGLLCAIWLCCFVTQAQNTRSILFDQGWRFKKDSTIQAESPSFNDGDWRKLDLPHDWSIEDLPNQQEGSVQGFQSKASIGKMGTGYMVGGTAWYRKHFTISKADEGKTAYLQFDGVYMNADVWVNGKHLGNHPYGYTSFWYDITPYLNPAGSENVVAVQVKNDGQNARWYSGSGIYRHTWLTLVRPVHVAPWGVYVTNPDASEKKASVVLKINIKNASSQNRPVNYVVKLLSPSGAEVGKATGQVAVAAGQSTELEQTITVNRPALWSLEKPTLYRAQVELLVNTTIADRYTQTFGIRSIHFDAQTGFTLNGKMVKLKGGCIHHDNGPLGAVAIDRAEERKIELLKKEGYNAIRSSHNPPSPYLLDVCDRLGVLVIDEAFDMWERPKMEFFSGLLGGGGKIQFTEYGKHFKEWWQRDLQSMLLRDRNHPSIIMWSIGNEIPEASDTSGFRIAKQLADEVKKFDPTRPVTEANVDMGTVFGGKKTWDIRAPHLATLDVNGYNYGYDKYEVDHKNYPERIMYASEYYPNMALENWQKVEANPYVIGAFKWTAMDYLGESGIGFSRLVPENSKKLQSMGVMMMFYKTESWPYFNAYCGDLDLIGNKKLASYYQDVVWRRSRVELFVHRPIPAGMREQVAPFGFPDESKSWTWPGQEGNKMQVLVYTRSKQVKLELNGKIIAEQTVPDTSITATFEIPYESGTLIARSFDGGKETGSSKLTTAGKPAAIRLKADRSTIKANPNDLSYIGVEVVDDKGNLVPYVDDLVINYQVQGSAEIAGVGNGNPGDVSSVQQPQKKVFGGKGLVIVRPKGGAGNIIIKVTAAGLKAAQLTITTK
jgi:beta-galactosidase